MSAKEDLIRDICSLSPFELDMQKVAKEVVMLLNDSELVESDLDELRCVLSDAIDLDGYRNNMGLRATDCTKYRLAKYDTYLNQFRYV